jgi:WhiB family redox-sensing transcriptional regulator
LKDSSWFDEAYCLNYDTESFFQPELEDHIIQSFCSKCPVKKQCLDYALASRNIYGVWGGIHPLDLRKALCLDIYDRATGEDPICPKCHSKNVVLDKAKKTSNFVMCKSCGLSWKSAVRLKIMAKKDDYEDEE